jgi:hypothetical protein
MLAPLLGLGGGALRSEPNAVNCYLATDTKEYGSSGCELAWSWLWLWDGQPRCPPDGCCCAVQRGAKRRAHCWAGRATGQGLEDRADALARMLDPGRGVADRLHDIAVLLAGHGDLKEDAVLSWRRTASC